MLIWDSGYGKQQSRTGGMSKLKRKEATKAFWRWGREDVVARRSLKKKQRKG